MAIRLGGPLAGREQKAVVGFVADHAGAADPGQQIGRPVGGTVVHDDRLEPNVALVRQRLQGAAGQAGLVEQHDHDRQVRLGQWVNRGQLDHPRRRQPLVERPLRMRAGAGLRIRCGDLRCARRFEPCADRLDLRRNTAAIHQRRCSDGGAQPPAVAAQGSSIASERQRHLLKALLAIRHPALQAQGRQHRCPLTRSRPLAGQRHHRHAHPQGVKQAQAAVGGETVQDDIHLAAPLQELRLRQERIEEHAPWRDAVGQHPRLDVAAQGPVAGDFADEADHRVRHGRDHAGECVETGASELQAARRDAVRDAAAAQAGRLARVGRGQRRVPAPLATVQEEHRLLVVRFVPLRHGGCIAQSRVEQAARGAPAPQPTNLHRSHAARIRLQQFELAFEWMQAAGIDHHVDAVGRAGFGQLARDQRMQMHVRGQARIREVCVEVHHNLTGVRHQHAPQQALVQLPCHVGDPQRTAGSCRPPGQRQRGQATAHFQAPVPVPRPPAQPRCIGGGAERRRVKRGRGEPWVLIDVLVRRVEQAQQTILPVQGNGLRDRVVPGVPQRLQRHSRQQLARRRPTQPGQPQAHPQCIAGQDIIVEQPRASLRRTL